MNDQSSSSGPSSDPAARLDSWKDIASYLKRDVSTVQRWEKREGMPVHRHLHDKLGSVYAFTTELDAWSRSRATGLRGAGPEQKTESGQPPVDEADAAEDALPAETIHSRADDWPIEPTSATVPRRRSSRAPVLWVIGALAFTGVAATLLWLQQADYFWRDPLANARFTRLTDFEGAEHAASISRDGKFVAFLSDRDGPVDVWLTQVGTGQFHNLTRGRVAELVNPEVRTLGFSPDGTLVTMWTRRRASHAAVVGVLAIPTLSGEPKPYLEGVAEFDWSSDGTRLVHHTPAPGDPMFVTDQTRRVERRLFTGASGLHSHYPLWSRDGAFIYFVHGTVADDMDIWRISSSGGTPQRITSHHAHVSHPVFLNDRTLLYLAAAADGTGPWLHTLNVNRRKVRRISPGVERYTSIAASSDGSRVVLTLSNPKRTLWRTEIEERVADNSAIVRVPHSTNQGWAPRVSNGSVFYVSRRAEAESISKLTGAAAMELWSAKGARVIGGPAVAPGGGSVAFTAAERGRKRMYVMNADGSALRSSPELLEPDGPPAWAPDGKSIVVAGRIEGAPGVVRVSPDGQRFTRLASGFAADPVWSPDGRYVIYSGPEIGTTFQLRAVGADGRPRPMPNITLSRGSRRIAFLRSTNELVVLRGELKQTNLWAINLENGRARQLTAFSRDVVITDFDVSPDGREIVFDREQDNSDVILVDR